MAVVKGGKKNRKLGRNKVKCERYRAKVGKPAGPGQKGNKKTHKPKRLRPPAPVTASGDPMPYQKASKPMPAVRHTYPIHSLVIFANHNDAKTEQQRSNWTHQLLRQLGE